MINLLFSQIFETSDLPGGVVNILSGARDHISKYLVEHQNVDAMWYFGSKEGSKFVEHTSAGNIFLSLFFFTIVFFQSMSRGLGLIMENLVSG